MTQMNKFKEFSEMIEAKSIAKLKSSANYLKKEFKTTLSMRNPKGTNPSSPGEPPRRLSGTGVGSLVRQELGGGIVQRIGVGESGRHLMWLEHGIGKRRITAHGRALRIPMAFAKQSGLSVEELKEMGAKRIGSVWYIFRRSVEIGPIAPRPWMRPTWLREKGTVARIALGIE